VAVTLVKTACPFVAATALFWIPTLLLHAVRGSLFSGRDVLVLSAVLPALVLIGFGVIARYVGPRATAFWMLLGIWLPAPLMTTINGTFTGGGFARAGGLRSAAVGTALFPVYALLMSAYDGTLFALLLASAGLVAGLVLGRPRRVAHPPGREH
jgi:hypothetical protein